MQSEMLVAGNGEVAKKSAIRKIAEKIALIIRARTLKNKIDYTGTEWFSGGVGPQGETYPMWRVKCCTERWSWKSGYEVILNGSATLCGKNGLMYTSRTGNTVTVRPAEGLVCALCAEDTPDNAILVAELADSVARFSATCESPTPHTFEDINNL
jgi:NAD-dependent dihydropyrimidine dehydrogenase PreA subunit